MEQISALELADEKVYPSEPVLKAVLGPSYPAYADLLALYEDYGLTCEWRYYKDGKAWLCKVRRKGRTIAWMSAWKGYMKATIYVPAAYIDGLQTLDISDGLKRAIAGTKNIGASKPCMFEIRDAGVLKELEKVMQYKLGMK